MCRCCGEGKRGEREREREREIRYINLKSKVFVTEATGSGVCERCCHEVRLCLHIHSSLSLCVCTFASVPEFVVARYIPIMACFRKHCFLYFRLIIIRMPSIPHNELCVNILAYMQY